MSNVHLVSSSVFSARIAFAETSQRVDRLYTSESDVCRRQILTYIDGSRAERFKLFISVLDPYYSIQVNQKE